jgi:threonine/homoserine/homoserine lactone efflux protein
MLDMLISAYTIGLLVALAPGVITVATVQRTCSYGFRDAVVFNLGVTVSDALYLLMVFLGLHLLVAGNALLNLALLIFSGTWLGWLGFSVVRQHLRLEQSPQGEVAQSNWRCLKTGFFMNTLSPFTIMGWAAIAGTYFSRWSLTWPPLVPYGLLASATMVVGVFTWQFALILLLCAIRRMVQPIFLTTLSVVGGVFMVIFGLIAWRSALELMVQIFV